MMLQDGEADCRKRCYQFAESGSDSAADVTE